MHQTHKVQHELLPISMDSCQSVTHLEIHLETGHLSKGQTICSDVKAKRSQGT